VLDTAINYRSMRSERVVGRALRDLEAGGFPRAAVCVVTKGGFVTADAADPRWPARYLREEFVEPGFLDPGDAGRRHSIAPDYIDASLAKSLRNLGLEHVDVYLLHNPEHARDTLDEERFYERLTAAFAVLEARVREGRVGAYGVATWSGLRVPPWNPQHLSLERTVKCAREASSGTPHFRYVELPMNARSPEASERPTQSIENRLVPALVAADLLGLTVLTSASLVHDAEATPPVLRRLPAMPAPLGVAPASLQLVRSVPAVACALAGMRRLAHVEEALAVARLPALTGMNPARLAT
jgi:aryl-alcohol dehydrogenase-like predicted oxidoreductase